MNDDDDVIRATLQRAARHTPTVQLPDAAVRSDIERRISARRRRRTVAASAVAGCCLAAFAVAIGWQVATRDPVVRLQTGTDGASTIPVADQSAALDRSVPVSSEAADPASEHDATTDDATTDGASAESQPGMPDRGLKQATWIRVPSEPLSPRVGAVRLALKGALFVWGGSTPEEVDSSLLTDGALLDPDGVTWKQIATSPLPGGHATAAFTGSEVVVVNGGLVALYDPGADSWRSLSPPDGAIGADTVPVVTPAEVIFLPSGWTWNRLEESWRQRAAPPSWPLSGYSTTVNPSALTTAQEIIVYGDSPNAASFGGSKLDGLGLRYDLVGDLWTELPVSPIDHSYASPAAAIVGDQLIVVSWGEQAAAFDLVNETWRNLPAFPGIFSKCLPDAVTTSVATVMVSMCDQHAVLDPATDRWIAFSLPEDIPWYRSNFVQRPDAVQAGDWMLIDVPPSELETTILGPLRIAGLSIDGALRPRYRPTEQPLAIDGTRPSVLDLGPDGGEQCALTVNQTDHDDQVTLSEVADLAGVNPRTWWNRWNEFSLDCPHDAAFDDIFAGLEQAGERSSPDDATEEILALDVGSRGSAEELFEAYSAAIDGTVALDWRNWEIETSVAEDDSISGLAYRLTIEPTAQGFVVISATVQSICHRGVDPSGLCV